MTLQAGRSGYPESGSWRPVIIRLYAYLRTHCCFGPMQLNNRLFEW